MHQDVLPHENQGGDTNDSNVNDESNDSTGHGEDTDSQVASGHIIVNNHTNLLEDVKEEVDQNTDIYEETGEQDCLVGG